MSNLIYHVAMSVDGFIADSDGGVGWLPTPDSVPAGEDFGFGAFYAGLDAVVIGSATYLQVLELTDGWPYANLEAVVMTRQPLQHTRDGLVRFSNADPQAVLADLRAKHQRDIWLVGGGALAASFAAQGLIDVYDVAIMPILLGTGVPFFGRDGASQTHPLQLAEQQTFSGGVLRLKYHKK